MGSKNPTHFCARIVLLLLLVYLPPLSSSPSPVWHFPSAVFSLPYLRSRTLKEEEAEQPSSKQCAIILVSLCFFSFLFFAFGCGRH